MTMTKVIWDNDTKTQKRVPLSDAEVADVMARAEKTEARRAENLIKDMRRKRDRLLRESDSLMQPDRGFTDEQIEAIQAYRQALRDIPQKYPDAINIEWPEKPV